MRVIGKGALLSAVALAAIVAFGATTASAQNKCLSGKTKCVSKKLAGLLKCRGKCEKDPAKCGGVETLCVNKVIAKFDGGTKGIEKGCIGKLDLKNDGPCITFGDTASLEAKVDAYVADVIAELETPFSSPNKCLSGKSKCVSKKTEGLLKCIGKCQKDPAKCGGVQTLCENKVIAKFDGGTKGIEKGCIGKLDVKNDGPCATFGDTAPLEAKVDAFVADVKAELESAIPATCPSQVTFVGTTTGPALDAGWSGQSHDSKTISDGLVTMTAFGCAGTAPNCGVCNYTGPIANGPGGIDNQRCSNDSSTPCTADSDCSGGGTCEFYFGSYLPLSAGGVATCVGNVFNGAVTGTFNEDTGATDGSAALTATVYSGPTADNPCPKCVGDTTLNDGVQGGTCQGGANSGAACDAMGTSPIPHFGSTSLDCPPPALGQIAVLPIDLSNTTGTKTKTLSAANPNCRAVGFTTLKCFCDTCDDVAATPCATNADCGGGICGGKRCQGGANNGTPCSTGTECPGGACGVPGQATAPNQCDDATCNAIGGDNGECQGGPFEQFCGPSAEFKSCTSNPECTPFNICAGGSNDGFVGCTVDSECPGGVCEIQTCSTGHFRKCFLDNGAIAGQINAQGNPDPPVGHQSDPTLAALFCIGPTSSGAVNAVAGLPGPGRLRLLGHATDNGTP
jgi:hypothetical protein